jgi:hypothetical protein
MALGLPAPFIEFDQNTAPFPSNPFRKRAVIQFKLRFACPIVGFACGAGEKTIPQLPEGF